MTEVRLRWTWTLQSPLHCGSGMSRAGRADRLVQRDTDGHPVIVGDAVKGALRMSAEQLAGWLGVFQRYDTSDRWLAEPTSRPLALVFGGDASAHFQPAVLAAEAIFSVFTSTAINPVTGTADDQTLRTTEFVPAGARFTSSVSVAVDDSDADAVATLLVGALAATEHVGAKAAIGWGAMQVAQLDVYVGDSAIEPRSVVEGSRLESLRTALQKTYEAVRPVVASGATGTVARAWYRLDIELREPATLGGGADVSNTTDTEAAIRATTLRGACAQAWRRRGAGEADILNWLSDATRWSPGFPAADSAPLVPVPSSWMCPKRQPKRAVIDALAGRDHPSLDGERVQWVSVRRGWMAWRDGGPLEGSAAALTRMHVARNYATGSKVSGALYARESIAPGAARFVAFASLPRDAWRDTDAADLWLGKRKSAGNGLASATVTRIDSPSLDLFGGSRFTGGRPPDADVYIQLLSPAIVRDMRSGNPLRTLDVAWWTGYLGLASADVAADTSGPVSSARRTAYGRRGGWMTPWRHPRAPVTVVEQGSVWRLRCRDVSIAEGIRARFASGLTQIGERQHEGFGWIAFDPAWLGIDLLQRAEQSESLGERLPGAPLAWPGIGMLPRDAQLKLLKDLPADVSATAVGPLHELARQAREARDQDHLNGIRDFFNGRIARNRSDGWAELQRKRALPDECWSDPDRLRFRLEALLIRATPLSGSATR